MFRIRIHADADPDPAKNINPDLVQDSRLKNYPYRSGAKFKHKTIFKLSKQFSWTKGKQNE